MMRAPDFSHALVPKQKICGYLLRTDHAEGASKARFFLSRGFSERNWEQLAEALRGQAMADVNCEVIGGRFGTKYVVEAPIGCPDGSIPMIRSVWIASGGSENLRLVTAHPL